MIYICGGGCKQKVPPEMPRVKSVKQEEAKKEYNTTSNNSGDFHEEMGVVSSGSAWQTWHQNGTRCPKGTVPIRRSSVHDVLRAKSLYHFGKKQRRMAPDRRADAPDVVSGNGHEVRFHLFPSSHFYSLFYFTLPSLLASTLFQSCLHFLF